MHLSDHFKPKEGHEPLQRHNVNFIIYNDDGQILLFKRFCKKSLAMSGQTDFTHPAVDTWYDIPGGRVDHPEQNIAAIIRENLEELGILVTASLHLTTMPNPSPGCIEGSTRSIYVVTEYQGVPHNKAGLHEGHIGFEAFVPAEAVAVLGDKIDNDTRDFLNGMAPDFFTKFCHQHQATQISPVLAPAI